MARLTKLNSTGSVGVVLPKELINSGNWSSGDEVSVKPIGTKSLIVSKESLTLRDKDGNPKSLEDILDMISMIAPDYKALLNAGRITEEGARIALQQLLLSLAGGIC